MVLVLWNIALFLVHTQHEDRNHHCASFVFYFLNKTVRIMYYISYATGKWSREREYLIKLTLNQVYENQALIDYN